MELKASMNSGDPRSKLKTFEANGALKEQSTGMTSGSYIERLKPFALISLSGQ